MLQAPSMHKTGANIIRISIFLFLLIGNERIAKSSFVNSSEMGGLNVVPGAYIITGKTCADGTKIAVDPDSRLKMQLIVKRKQTYFFRRMDSKCTYMQYVTFKNQGEGNASVYFGKSMRLGNCYYKPDKLISSPLTMKTIKTSAKNKNLSIEWANNPSLKDCSGQAISWNFKRLKKYKRSKSRKLARNPLYGTL